MSKGSICIYNSTFENYTSVENIATRQSGTITYKLSNAAFNNISVTNSLFSNATLNVSGIVTINNASVERSVISASVNVEKTATLSIVNSRISRNTEGNAVINMSNAASLNLQGSLVVKDNKVVGCNESNNQGII